MEQRSLIPLTTEQLASKSRQLAQAIWDLQRLKAEHAELKRKMTNDEIDLTRRIERLALHVREGAEEGA